MKGYNLFSVIDSLYKTVENCKGKHNLTFAVGQKGQKVYVRNYSNPNKLSWSPGTVRKQLDPRNYTVWLSSEDRIIKRHLDQIRKAETCDEGEHPSSISTTVDPAHIASDTFTETENAENLEDTLSERGKVVDTTVNVAQRLPHTNSKRNSIEAMHQKI